MGKKIIKIKKKSKIQKEDKIQKNNKKENIKIKRIYCDIKKCLRCRRCELACYMKNASVENVFELVKVKEKPVKNIELVHVHETSMPLICRQCEEALCVDACISGALTYDEDKKIIYLDKDKCVGCWSCIMRCPNGSISNFKNKAIKCDLCFSKEIQACINACPTKALYIE